MDAGLVSASGALGGNRRRARKLLATLRRDGLVESLVLMRGYIEYRLEKRFGARVDRKIGSETGGRISLDRLEIESPNVGEGVQYEPVSEFYFRRIEDTHNVPVANGMADRQIWITEFGWATPNNTPGYEYGNSISPETQAAWIVRAFEIGRGNWAPWVGAMFVWNLNFAVPWRASGNEFHEQASFGVVNGDWTPRPAFNAIQSLSKR